MYVLEDLDLLCSGQKAAEISGEGIISSGKQEAKTIIMQHMYLEITSETYHKLFGKEMTAIGGTFGCYV